MNFGALNGSALNGSTAATGTAATQKATAEVTAVAVRIVTSTVLAQATAQTTSYAGYVKPAGSTAVATAAATSAAIRILKPTATLDGVSTLFVDPSFKFGTVPGVQATAEATSAANIIIAASSNPMAEADAQVTGPLVITKLSDADIAATANVTAESTVNFQVDGFSATLATADMSVSQAGVVHFVAGVASPFGECLITPVGTIITPIEAHIDGVAETTSFGVRTQNPDSTASAVAAITSDATVIQGAFATIEATASTTASDTFTRHAGVADIDGAANITAVIRTEFQAEALAEAAAVLPTVLGGRIQLPTTTVDGAASVILAETVRILSGDAPTIGGQAEVTGYATRDTNAEAQLISATAETSSVAVRILEPTVVSAATAEIPPADSDLLRSADADMRGTATTTPVIGSVDRYGIATASASANLSVFPTTNAQARDPVGRTFIRPPYIEEFIRPPYTMTFGRNTESSSLRRVA